MSKGPCDRSHEGCKYFPKCFSDNHHPDWPKKDYKTKLEQQFRRSRAIGMQICRELHDTLHALPPPEKPSPAQMRAHLSLKGADMEYVSDKYNQQLTDLAESLVTPHRYGQVALATLFEFPAPPEPPQPVVA